MSREYSFDPLEILFVREVMRTNIVALPEGATVREHHARRHHGQVLYPVVDTAGALKGVMTRAGVMHTDPVVAYPDEPLRLVVERMAETGRTRMPVIDRTETRKLAGMVSLTDLLKARVRNLDEERKRERVLRVRLPAGQAEFVRRS